MKLLTAISLIASVSFGDGFTVTPINTNFLNPKTTLKLSSSENAENNVPPSRSSSRIEGNARDPTAQELSVMDDMITKLSQAKPYELPNAVKQAFRVVSSPKFFLRIAQRVDMTDNKEEKERLQALATNLVSTLDAVVSTAEDKLEEHAEDVQRILRAASEPISGEFLVPLSAERIKGMKQVMENDMSSSQLSEGFLATIDSWMNKSQQDGIDGMVVILQKILQLYAGIEISRARSKLLVEVSAAVTGEDENTVKEKIDNDTTASKLLETLLSIDTDLWEDEINNNVVVDIDDAATPSTDCSFSQLTAEVQRTMEGVVLGLENGSMAQRVQAEYLRELMVRIEALEKKQK